jgi:GTPase SAR1 family protein
MAERQGRPLPFNPNPERDINILLLGETGVGKTTFINAFVNYLVYDTLDAALQGEMQVLIPSAFAIADAQTHTPTTITVGSPDDNEVGKDNGQSQTKGCKSYLFSLGDRYLRLIDTPGIGDCRGVEQDNKNFEHILAFISRYEHLNGICILLKPNEHRLNIFFRYGIKELLKHLHVNAKDNIMFAFTNSRANFYSPGATSNQLRILLTGLEGDTNTRIPFERENTFLFENESFRFLAVCKAGHKFFMEHKPTFIDSWDRSVAELNRMLTRIVKCDLHAVRDMESLNEAQQLVKKLSRPIGEIATLIEENIQLAKQHKSKVLANENDITSNRIPQKTAEILPLDYPRTICTSKKCSKVITVNGEMKVDYTAQCHERCYLKGVEQEVISNPILKHCRAMDKITG